MGKESYTPKGISKVDLDNAMSLFKSGLRWEMLRKVKTRIQQAWEYLRTTVEHSRWHNSRNPYKGALQSIEMLMHTPFLPMPQLEKHLAVLREFLDENEVKILVVAPWPICGSL